MGNQKLAGQLAIDGKALRDAGKRRGNKTIHMVNAWSTDLGMCIGQQKIEEKSNEITAIPKSLKMLELEGCLVSIDAAGTQTKIANIILEKDANYLLAVKDNQPKLSNEIKQVFRGIGIIYKQIFWGLPLMRRLIIYMSDRNVDAAGLSLLMRVCHFVRNGKQKSSSRCKPNER